MDRALCNLTFQTCNVLVSRDFYFGNGSIFEVYLALFKTHTHCCIIIIKKQWLTSVTVHVEIMLPLHCHCYTVVISSTTLVKFVTWDYNANSVL
jgi:hypothetical protein